LVVEVDIGAGKTGKIVITHGVEALEKERLSSGKTSLLDEAAQAFLKKHHLPLTNKAAVVDFLRRKL